MAEVQLILFAAGSIVFLTYLGFTEQPADRVLSDRIFNNQQTDNKIIKEETDQFIKTLLVFFVSFLPLVICLLYVSNVGC